MEAKFLLNGISFDNDNPINSVIDDNFEYDMSNSLENQYGSYVSPFILKTSIKDSQELKGYVNQIKKNENLKSLIDKIKAINLLYEYLLSQNSAILDELNGKINDLNKNYKIIKDLEILANEKKLIIVTLDSSVKLLIYKMK